MPEYESKNPELAKTPEGNEQLQGPERRELSPEQLEEGRNERFEQLEAARLKLEQQPEPQASAAEKDTIVTNKPTRLDKEVAYVDTLRSLQRHLSPASRQFSKVIHSPTVEKTSEIAGATVARPSVLLGATTTAALLGGFLYVTARVGGFSLSGSEFILSLVVGGVLGLIIEGLAKIIKPKR